MDFNYIKRLVKLVDESEVTELEIEEDGKKIKISKKVKTTFVPANYAAPVNTQPVQQTPVKDEKISTAEIEDKSENYYEIKSPMVGTFYRASSPEAEPYVKVGEFVTKGNVLCLIEAMKLMNQIEADVSGKIVKILVEDGKPVEYNQTLFLIEKAV